MGLQSLLGKIPIFRLTLHFHILFECNAILPDCLRVMLAIWQSGDVMHIFAIVDFEGSRNSAAFYLIDNNAGGLTMHA